jgi:hypothetical protein
VQRWGGAVEADLGGEAAGAGLFVEAGEVRTLVEKAALDQNVEKIGLGTELVGHWLFLRRDLAWTPDPLNPGDGLRNLSGLAGTRFRPATAAQPDSGYPRVHL